MSVSHERKLIDDEAPPEKKATIPLPPLHFVAQIRGNAVAKSQHGLRVARTARKDSACERSNSRLSASKPWAASIRRSPRLLARLEAQIALKNFVKQNPAQKEQFVVVPLWEMVES